MLVDVLCATLSTSVGEGEKRARDKGRIRREGKNVGGSLFSLPFSHCELWRKRKRFSLIIIIKNNVTNRLRRREKSFHHWSSMTTGIKGHRRNHFFISTFLFLSPPVSCSRRWSMCQHYLTVVLFSSAFPLSFSTCPSGETDRRAIVCAWIQCQVIMNMWTRISRAIILRVRSNQLSFDWPITSELALYRCSIINPILDSHRTNNVLAGVRKQLRANCQTGKSFYVLNYTWQKCLSWDNLIITNYIGPTIHWRGVQAT